MKLLFLLTVFASVLLVSGRSVSEEVKPKGIPPSPRVEDKSKPKYQNHATKTNPSKLAFQVHQSPAEPNTDKCQKGTQDWTCAFGPDAWPNWALVIVGGIATIIALRTLEAIHRQANIAESNLRVVERAWLAVRFDQPFQPKAGAHNPIYYSVKNTGHTIAFLKDRKLNAMPWNGFIPKREPAPKPTGILPTIAAIFPGGKFPMEGLVDINFTQQMINDAATGRFIFDVRGYVAYDDAFGNRHITRFCQAYDPNGDSGSFTYPREAQPGYNDAD